VRRVGGGWIFFIKEGMFRGFSFLTSYNCLDIQSFNLPNPQPTLAGQRAREHTSLLSLLSDPMWAMFYVAVRMGHVFA